MELYEITLYISLVLGLQGEDLLNTVLASLKRNNLLISFLDIVSVFKKCRDNIVAI